MQLKYFVLSFSFLAAYGVSSEAGAQIVNIQSSLSGDIPEGPAFTAEFRQEKKSGNTDTERLAGQGTLTYQRPEDLWLLLVKREYSTESGQSSADSYFHHLRYRYRISESWGWEAYLQEDADRFRRSARRNVFGTGPRFQISPIKGFDVAASVAYMHEREEFSQSDGVANETKRDTDRVANVLYFSWQWPDCCTLSNVAYFQPSVRNVRNHKTLNETSLLFQINKHMSYRVSYNYAYNGRPPEGVDKVDTNFLQALVLKI